MKIELLGAIDYAKLREELKRKNVENCDEIIKYIEELEKFGRVQKVSTSGRLSRFVGDVFEVLGMTNEKTFEQNTNFAKRVISMGHDSITDHDYLVFAIKDVSPVIEQTIIAERFSSFTIKSRREVDFSNVGFYTPDFHDKDGNVLENNEMIKNIYQKYMNSLFEVYSKFVDAGVPKEDARFVLPYCYHSNIIMGIDAHTLKDMIIKYTKTHLSKVQELREFGERLYEIAKENVPYIIDEIDKIEYQDKDLVNEFIESYHQKDDYMILDKPELLNHSSYIDDTILISAIMRRYQLDFRQASTFLEEMERNYKKETGKDDFKKEFMRKIVFEGDKQELTQVNFQYQIPLSFAVLTHLTRHRTHQMLIPEFAPTVDLSQYKVPTSIAKESLEEYKAIFENNIKMYAYLKDTYGICDEDLVYFTLSGNIVNVVTNMDGKTLEHILGLRECTKAQWETRNMAIGMHNEIRKIKDAEIFSSLLGSTCMTQGYCKEGKESCGRLLQLQNKNN